jgi:hypothetical protein
LSEITDNKIEKKHITAFRRKNPFEVGREYKACPEEASAIPSTGSWKSGYRPLFPWSH